MNRRCIGLIVFLLIQSLSTGFSQEEPDIQRYLDMIQQRQKDQVKEKLPMLYEQYPQHPGVIYLNGVLTLDGAEAAKIFQSVVDNFPESEWADDALYRVYQFYYSLGLYRTADGKLAELKRRYPQSEYVTGKKPATVTQKKTPKPTTNTQQPAQRPTLPERKTTQSAPRPEVARTGTAYSVQAGAFLEMRNASSLERFLQREGYDVEVRSRDRGGQRLHVVWVGSFATLEEAKELTRLLQAKYNIDSFVVAR